MPRRGPTTEQGRSIARFNAMKHGFAARSPIIPELEDQEDWERHHKGIIESLKPEGYFEEVLVRRIATAGHRAAAQPSPPQQRRPRGDHALRRFAAPSLGQTLNQLRAAQAGRRGEHVPVALVDISAAPNLGAHRSASSKVSDFLEGTK